MSWFLARSLYRLGAPSLIYESTAAARRASRKVAVSFLTVWFAGVLARADGATLDDLHKSITTFEEILRITRRVLGGAHPVTTGIERDLRNVRAALRAHESPQSASGGA